MAESIVILAAGLGKRMHSQLPKVLHRIAGKTLLEHVVDTSLKLNHSKPPIIVYGHQGDVVRHTLAHLNAEWVEQSEQLGTAHALQQTLPRLPTDQRVLVLYGDVPLISLATLTHFIQTTPADALGIVTAHLANPHGFGRMIRDAENRILRIVEEKDATDAERQITEINSGIYLIPSHALHTWLPAIQNQNAQKEFYLTDIVAMAVRDQVTIHSVQPLQNEEILGVNDRVQLANLERFYQRNIAEKLMRQGVTLLDPARLDVRGEVSIGQDVIIDVNVILEGHVKIGHGCIIGPNTILRNTVLGNHVEIKANSMLDGAEVADQCYIGPFARLRPGAVLASDVHIGNFVEIKNSRLGSNTKANHLSYVGDSDVGSKVNIGAGTITCNYDGVNKHKTTIGDDVLVGSNTSLIAPVTLHDGATIGAGSIISRDAPAHQLTVCRVPQRSLANWQRPKKKERAT